MSPFRRMRRGLGATLVLVLSAAAAYAAGTLYRDGMAPEGAAACAIVPARGDAASPSAPEPGPGSAVGMRTARTGS